MLSNTGKQELLDKALRDHAAALDALDDAKKWVSRARKDVIDRAREVNESDDED